jgi:hypothetical protein
MASMAGSEELCGGGSLESVVRRLVLCWCIWQKSGFSAVKMFSHLIYFIKKLCNCCTFDAICKDNAAANSAAHCDEL